MTRKEAINTVRNIYQTDKEKEALEILIPELAESEDERIRKGMLAAFKRSDKEVWSDAELSIKDIIAWLEKQKEQNVVPSRETILGIWELGNLWKENPEERNGLTQLQYIQKYWFEKNDYQKENKPSISCGHENDIEWSEEDETTYDTFICEVVNKKMNPTLEQVKWIRNLRDRLKSLRPQPQRRDTYYDIIHSILDMLKDKDFTQITPEHRVSLLNDIRVKCKHADEWAGILDEPHWKPSEEQMNVITELKNETKDSRILHVLAGLYSALKKL